MSDKKKGAGAGGQNFRRIPLKKQPPRPDTPSKKGFGERHSDYHKHQSR